MDAIVMDGKTLASGAVSAVRNIANPIQLARLVMDKVCMFLLTELQELCGIMFTAVAMIPSSDKNKILYA